MYARKLTLLGWLVLACSGALCGFSIALLLMLLLR